MGAIRFSPDGKWLLWATGTANHPLWAVLELATSRTITRPRLQPATGLCQYDFAWLPESRHWTERSLTETTVPIYSVDSEQVEHSELSSPASLTQPNSDTTPLSAILNPSPPQAQSMQQMLSSAHDRFAWFAPDDNPMRDLPSSRRNPNRSDFSLITPHQYALWVSNADGRNARQIISGFPDEAAPVCLNWSPDGKHLSFYYQNTLWITSSD